MYRELLSLLDESIVVLTANQRLAQQLHRQYEQYQIQQQQVGWPTPTILPLHTWLVATWQKHPQCVEVLLTEIQEQLLWQEVIQNSAQVEYLLHLCATATLVKQAWDTLTLWQIPLETLNSTVNETTQAFVHWAQAFAKSKQKRPCISPAELPQAFCRLIENKRLSLPKKIALVGFDEPAPAVQHLFRSMQQYASVLEFSSNKPAERLQRVQCADEETEIYTMARFAKKQWLHDPSQKMGGVLPNLANCRLQVERIFTEVFSPHRPFNISAGQYLNTFPMIQTAVAILQMNRRTVAFEQLSTLLRSPYLNSSQDEACLAAWVDVQMRNGHPLQRDPKELLPLFAKYKAIFPKTTLPYRWKAFLQICHESDYGLPSQWAQWFTKELSHIGWPGQRSLNSHEYQLLQRWQQLMNEFSQLDFISEPLSRRQALSWLIHMLKQTIFQPQSPEVPIQLLGLLEASGNEFDVLWVMGLDNESWPPAAKPNPFLPIDCQRQYNMPHASAERELHYSQQLQHRFSNSTSRIIFSSAQQQGDKHLTPSRLILAIPEIEIEHLDLTAHQNEVERVFESGRLETLDDHHAPYMQREEIIQGGSWILQQQSLCPFRAFASVRLKAKSLSEPQLGLDASERGILVHQALDTIWKIIKTQEKLLAYSESELQTIITTAVETTITNYPNDQFFFLTIEKQRLIVLVTEWLDFEKTRPPFEVAQQETLRHIKINALPITVKIDRIDRFSNGKYFIIDYKTRLQHTIDSWFGARLEDIQLPLYCVYGMNNTSGLAYAQVRRGRMKFKGLMADDEDAFSEITRVPIHWPSLLQQWQENLHTLSADFCSGKAAVHPIDTHLTCRYCDLQSLCRIGAER